MRWGWGVAVLVSAGVGLRIALSWFYPGFLQGDEVELLSSILRAGAGLVHEPWEIRNLTVPIALGPWAALQGLASPLLIVWNTLPFALVGGANAGFVAELARRWGLGERWAFLAGLLYTLHWIPLTYGSAASERQFATCAILLALLLLAPRRRTENPVGAEPPIAFRAPWRLIAAGVLASFAFACRYSEVIALAVLAWVLVERGASRRSVLRAWTWVGIGFAVGAAFFVGWVDFVTWGRPFASLLAFADFTLVERASSSIEVVQPPFWYLWRLPHWFPLAALPLAWAGMRTRAGRLACGSLILMVVILSTIHHKELRYLQAGIPCVAIATAAGGSIWWERRRALVVVLLAFGALSGLLRVSKVQKRSMPAVSAARVLARTENPGTIALVQPWAWGGGIYLRDWDIRDLPLETNAATLREAVDDSVDVVGVYEENLGADPALGPALASWGFHEAARYSRVRSRSVVVFQR